jgi:rifampicin phosphotransferase
LWTERAIAYRSRMKIDSADVRIAVVLQPMINAEVAGVMFTADPVSGDRETIVVDASSGLARRWSRAWSHLITTCSMAAV